MGLAPTQNKRLHKKNKWNKCKNYFHMKIMRHVGMEVPKVGSIYAERVGDNGMQQ